jgi:hypothetical protein
MNVPPFSEWKGQEFGNSLPRTELDIHSMMIDRNNTALFKNIVKAQTNRSATPIEDEFGTCEIGDWSSAK